MNHEQDSSTRSIILVMLKTKGSLSVNGMAKELGITEMAVRRHLNKLDSDGLIESRLARQAMGRPSHLYSLTEQADQMFPNRYHHLTLDLLGELAEEDGDEKIGRLFERRKNKLQGKYNEQMAGKTLTERISELADIQNANGYMVEWKENRTGQYEFKEYNCPISQVANQYKHACKCELSLFENLLDAQVQRTECLAEGGGKCVYLIQKKMHS